MAAQLQQKGAPMQTIESHRIHKIVGRELFDSEIACNEEVKNATGLTIDELLRGFIFSSRNQFAKELRKWKTTGELMQADEVFTKS